MHGGGCGPRLRSARSAASACGRAVVALPAVQADFGIARGSASLPFTLTMIGFGAGGIVMGRLADRFGVVRPLLIGVVALVAGYLLSAFATNIWQFALAQGLLGFGASGSFGPLMTDISHWFEKRRGIAVAIASCGNYLAGTIWPPLIQYFISTQGWRTTQIGIGLFCAVAMLPLILAMRRPAPAHRDADRRDGVERHARHARPFVQHVDGTADRRRRRLLRRHVDAAGPYRRLLRRSRLRAGARRRDALGDARLRPDQPHRLRLHRRPDRRPGDAADQLRAARRRAVPLSAVRQPDFALRDLGAVRSVPGRHRADVRRSSCASISRRARPARGSASC